MSAKGLKEERVSVTEDVRGVSVTEDFREEESWMDRNRKIICLPQEYNKLEFVFYVKTDVSPLME